MCAGCVCIAGGELRLNVYTNSGQKNKPCGQLLADVEFSDLGLLAPLCMGCTHGK